MFLQAIAEVEAFAAHRSLENIQAAIQYDFPAIIGSVAQIGLRPRFPFPRTDLSHSFRDGYSERGVAVQDGDADLEFGDLSVEVPCHEPLAQQLDTMPLCLDAASAVVSTPSSPERAAQVFRRAQGLISRHGSGGDRLPGLRVLAGRDDGMGTAICNRIVAYARVVGAISRNATDFLVLRDLVEKVG